MRDSLNDEHDRDLIRANVALAESFGANTIAEGIEDEETLALIRSLGSTHV